MMAILHYDNATYKPGCECLSFGATLAQGQRTYDHIENWCYEHDSETGRRTNVVKAFIDGKPLKSETKWKTGSKVEIVAGSENAVSGPHSAKTHADEVDQMEPGVWNQSRGIAVANKAHGPLPPFMRQFGDMIPPQDIVTSTVNSTSGIMQELLDEVDEDKKNGNIPQFNVRTWCIWECMAEIPNCQNAPEDQRRARLEELGRDPNELCECHRAVKGFHDDGEPRTLQDYCGKPDKAEPGHEYKGFRARGWKPYIDLVTAFKRNTPATWMLQHESRTARDQNLYITKWSTVDYGVRHYEPYPHYGPIYMGIDWGTENPAAILWFQYLEAEIPALDFNYQPIYLSARGYVLFKEIYTNNQTAEHLAKRVIDIEEQYRAQYGGAWEVKARFADPQGKGDRLTFKNYGLPTRWPVRSRERQPKIELVQNLVMEDRFSVDIDAAQAFCLEVEKWGKNPRTGKEIDKHNHAMSAWIYCIANSEVIESRNRAAIDEIQNNRQPQPETKGRRSASRYAHHGFNDRISMGVAAASGGTKVPMSERFSLNAR